MKLLLLLAFFSRAQAAVIIGTNYNGATLAPNNGDVLSGTFTAVGLFSITAGNTAFVAAGQNLVIYASTVNISGTLDGSGRGQPGGAGGTFISRTVTGNPGQSGFDGSGSLNAGGQGQGGAGGNNTTPTNASGGGGGGGGNAGGAGAGPTPGTGGPAYGTKATAGASLSSSDSFQGSGGGGGGANGNTNGGNGGNGGAAIYIEAASMTVTGSISVSGSTAPPAVNGSPGIQPAGGGGGGGGTLVLRIPGPLDLSAAVRLSADGGGGGNVDARSGASTLEPGGGGGGGRLKLFASQTAFGSVILSTAGGTAGGMDASFSGLVDATVQPGQPGTKNFGVIASSPTQFAAQATHTTSIDWSWTPLTAGLFGDGTNPAYRVFPASASIFANAASAPLPQPQASIAGAASGGVTETGLVPNTTYYRFVTAFTAWGDSLPSASVSTHTLCAAPVPGAPAFTGLADTALTVNWTSGQNSTSTVYELDASTSSNFTVPTSTSFLMFAQGVTPSSAPVNLIPNTSYYYRVRAINIDNVPTSYTAIPTTATLATVPTNAAMAGIYITSAAVSWSGGRNPPGTMYTASISTDDFQTVNATSSTLMTSATFLSLTPGTVLYYFKVQSTNLAGTTQAQFASTSTKLGILSDTSPPTPPGVPSPDRQFSYDGTLNFFWTPGASSVGILDYNLIVGSLPGASDFFNGNVSVTSFSAVGLTTGHTYYAQVRARSNAGVFSAFSGVSNGISVFITNQVSPVTKPINWPNPFNPASGPTQIGFFIDSPGSVVLKIFTLQGQLVHQASQGFGAAGNQIMTWDGNSDSGGRVAPGGYVALLEKHLSSGTTSQKLKIAILY